mmetsp:Transcript_28315/g.46585  ORF Transcript_28315/g.46585 Transcript_28315/m.46585 type:complete len:891 (+) Transcript_28315:81-2753(+)
MSMLAALDWSLDGPLTAGLCAAAAAVALAALLLACFGRPVSMPGGPRKRRLARRAEWSGQKRALSPGWVFATDLASHRVTEGQHPSFPKLTGESAGRQIWYKEDAKPGLLRRASSRSSLSSGTELGEGAAASPQRRKSKTLSVRGRERSIGSVKDLLNLVKGQDTENGMPRFSAAENPNSSDKLLREQMIRAWKGPKPTKKTPETATDACRKGIQFYQMLQTEDGHWAGDYGGPMFLLPGLVIAHHITGAKLAAYKREAMVDYLRNHQQTDGGWGTHIEAASTMFGTVLNYVALRLLGLGPDEPECEAARGFIHANGGALYTPSWGKFWLALLGAMEYDCINSVPPEMWLLPRWFPFHPGRLWCHCRMVYLPMCYLYGKRFAHTARAPADPLVLALRQELYPAPYATLPWARHRQTVSPLDEYDPVGPLMRFLQAGLAIYERWCPWKPGRARALRFAFDYLEAEDRQTNYVDIGPVNKSLNMLCVWAARGSDSEEFQKHLMRVDDYLWVAEDGMKMQGYNGSQCWDTSFAIQGVVESGLAAEFPEMCRRVHGYLDRTQIKADEDDRRRWFRHESRGGWPFSTAAHGWPISDCTSEGLKGVLALRRVPGLLGAGEGLAPERLHQAAQILLSYQNRDGGWATYENNRGYGWYEALNPSDVFGDIMIDYSYVECSTACLSALATFRKEFPEHRAGEIEGALERGRRFVKSIQRPDGSWYGSWGVCFCYATWFGIEGLVVSGEPLDSPHITRAVAFLLSKQRPNGGWGESYLSCVDKAYSEGGCLPGLGDGGSGVVQTAWALLGLMEGAPHDPKVRTAVNRGVAYLMQKQLADGDWEQEGLTGVFNRNCGITYTAYRNVFPIWALGRYGRLYEGAAAERAEQAAAAAAAQTPSG